MVGFSFEEICKITDGEFFSAGTPDESTVTEITADLKKIRNGCLFCCLQHRKYAAQCEMIIARLNGAAMVLGEINPYNYKIPFVRVSDSFSALQSLTEVYRARLKTKIIGITGTVGKTTTKEMLASVLSQKYRLYKTPESNNALSPVVDSVLSIRETDDFAVLELGIATPGEMEAMSRIVRPDIAVITNIGEAHLEGLKDLPTVLYEKSKIFDYMPSDGKIFLNRDDALLKNMTNVRGVSPDFFSRNDYTDPLPFPGEHFRLNAAAAAAVAKNLGFSHEEIAEGIARTVPAQQRCSVEKVGSVLFIDDYFNANPMSMKAAIDMLCEMPYPRTAILGDMLELGGRAESLHREIGEYAASKQIDKLVFIGSQAEYMYLAAKETAADNKVVLHYADIEAFQNSGDPATYTGGTVLLKASRGMIFEKVKEIILSREQH